MALLAFLSSPILARTVQCEMTQRSNAHYIGSDIAVEFLDYGEVEVRDQIITSAGRKSALGTVSRESAQRLSVVWEVRNVPADPAEFRRYGAMLQMRLTIQKGDGAAMLTANDVLYNRFSYRAVGACRFHG